MAVAQQHQVLQFGQSEVPPEMNMMGVAPSDRPITTGEPATAVAYCGGPEQVRWHGVLRARTTRSCSQPG